MRSQLAVTKYIDGQYNYALRESLETIEDDYDDAIEAKYDRIDSRNRRLVLMARNARMRVRQ